MARKLRVWVDHNVCVGNAGHCISHSRARSDQGNTQSFCELGMGMRHVHGGALVAHVNDADALRIGAHPNRHDVAAAQGEDPVHPLCAQIPRDDGSY